MNANVAIVTGASRGLGRALTFELAALGYTVVAVARGEGPLTEVVAELVLRGHRAVACAADVADPDAAVRIAGRAAALGRVTLLVNNASTLGPVPLRPLLDVRPAELAEVLATNVTGPFALTRAVAGAMALHGQGAVVFISSDAAVNAYPGWGAYGASKAAADHLARTLALELGPRGVTVTSVDPGELDTAMHAAAVPDADPATLQDPAVVARRLVATWVRS